MSKKKIKIAIIFVLILFFCISCNKEVTVSSPEQPKFETGKLFIDSKPDGSQIFVDEKFTGSITPDTILWLKEGENEVTLKRKFYEDREFIIKITNDCTTSFYYDYLADPKNYGSLELSSDPPGSSIYFNDSLLNQTTPHTIRSLVPGTYKIKLSFPIHRSDSTISIVYANNMTKSFFLLPDTTVWVTYNEENSKLINNSINSIYVDNNNLVWLGTREGIVQNKGNFWNLINKENSLLPNNLITKIIQNQDGTYWIGTSNGLVTIENDIWTTYQTSTSSLPGNFITDIDFDNLGNTWVGTNKGLVKNNSSNWTVYENLDPTYTANFITGVATNKENNNIWIGTNDFGIAKFDGNNEWEYYQRGIAAFFEGRPIYEINDSTIMSLHISTMEVDNNGNVWAGFGPSYLKAESIGEEVGMGKDYSGIERHDYSTDRWEVIDIGFSDIRIRDFHIDNNNNSVWISTGKGLIKKTANSSTKTFIQGNSGLPSSDITASYLDKNNILWVGTRTEGIVKYKGEQN